MARQCNRRFFQSTLALGGVVAALVMLLPSKFDDISVSQIISSSLGAAGAIKEGSVKGEVPSTTSAVERANTTGEAVSTTIASFSTSTQAPDGVTLPIWERAKLEKRAREREAKEHSAGSTQQFCSLRPCRMHDSEAPLLFVTEHSDGAGHRMKNIMDGLAVAVKNKMNLGGVLVTDNLVTEHGHDFHSLANRFLGDGSAPSHLFVTKRPNFTEEFKSLVQLERQRPRLQPGALIFLPDASEWSLLGTGTSQGYYSSELKEVLRQQLSLVPLVFAPRRPVVALHVRRGDLTQKDSRVLQTPDEYYFRLVDRIRDILPEADVHAWSSVQGYSAMGKLTYWTSSDFDSYRQRGIAVHLDGSDLMVPWAHLSQAHVFVMAPSSFSYVPAVLNPHCVIYRKIAKPLFPGWIDGDKLDGSPGDGLEKCVKHGTRQT